MLLKWWRFGTIMFVGLSMGPAICHLLEMPAKMKYDGSLWLKLLQTLCPPALGTIGAFFEVGAVTTTIILIFLVRKHKTALKWTLPGAICMVAVHLIFWIWVAPVNAAMAPLSPDTLPQDWTSLRDQWEYAHASRAILHMVSLAFLVLSILNENRNEIKGQTS